eukprot:1179898-Prorocentrum_minimum.AAC.3
MVEQPSQNRVRDVYKVVLQVLPFLRFSVCLPPFPGLRSQFPRLSPAGEKIRKRSGSCFNDQCDTYRELNKGLK